MWELSPKQKDFVMNSDGRYNLAIGSVRSGKTVAANFAFMRFAATDIKGPMVILGKTEHSIKTNILTPFSDILGKYFHYKAGDRKLYIAGREIDVIGASDLKAEGKIRGATYAGALVDEATVIPEPVFRQLTYRLSVPNARLFATTNPDSPYHWLKTGYIDQTHNEDIGVKVWRFNFDDNPTLDEGYIRKIKAESHGLWYKRFIEGEWVLAEGAIYDFFDESIHTIPHQPGMAQEYAIGIDYGTMNPCCFVLMGYNPNLFPQLWVEKEYYYDSQKSNRIKTDSEYAQDLARFIEGLPISAIYVDPSAASFKAEMRNAGISNIYDAQNDVMNGIRLVTEHLANGTMKICQCARNVIHEFSNYVWDLQAAQKGVEKPLKTNDHSMDAIRYVAFSRYQKLSQNRLTQEDMDRFHAEIYGRQPNLPDFFRDTGIAGGHQIL
jgi:PBSX family phage terminase large subunit